LPLVLVGGRGVLKTNQHVAYGPLGSDRQLRDMWFTVLRRGFGVNLSSFGEDVRGVSNADLTELLR
jgi:hypothetical protein